MPAGRQNHLLAVRDLRLRDVLLRDVVGEHTTCVVVYMAGRYRISDQRNRTNNTYASSTPASSARSSHILLAVSRE